MMNHSELDARLAHLGQLHQQAEALSQQIRHQWDKQRRLEGLAQTWDAQVVWEEGREWSWADLHIHKARLEDNARKAQTLLSPALSERKVQALETSLEQAQAGLARMRQLEAHIDRLEQLVRHWQKFKEIAQYVEQLAGVLQALATLQHTDISAYQQLASLREQLWKDQALHAEVVRLAQEIARILPNGDPEQWEALAVSDLGSLIIQIGSGEQLLQEELDVARTDLAQIDQALAEREDEVAPIRERVTQQEQEIRAYQERNYDETDLLLEWGRSALPQSIDQNDPNALQALRDTLQRELQHLAWFDELVQE